VDEVEAELRPGLTVLTGETGAGKSILVDALGLALGNRADSDAVRPGAERAEITATFSIIGNQNVNQWLKDNDLDESTSSDCNECVLRRVVTADGRSRGYINGNSVPMHLLRDVGALLVDICGQQAHQSLGQAENQRLLLDQHGDHLPLVEEHRNVWREWQALQQEYDKLNAASADQATRIDLLRFQVHELDALDARPGELGELEQSHRIAANASRIQQNAGAALQMLYDNEQVSAYDLASKARSYLDELSELDPSLGTLAAQLTEAEIIMSEAADTLRRYLDRESPDAANLAGLENRLAAMHDMARKHRVTAAELPELTIRLRDELQRLEHSDDTLDELRQAIATRFALLQELGAKLTSARQRAAKSLSKEVTRNIQQLGMGAGKFSVNLETLDKPGATGSERIEFRVALNPGIPAGALSKVASGGELSRVSLAIQVAASRQTNIPTLIFDEVDTGVGGGTADIVGQQLRKLGTSSQVLCVTHLAQVASKGQQHFRVSKLSDGRSTRTRVMQLTHDERVEELARMLGGVEITDRTRDHAAEMLSAGAK